MFVSCRLLVGVPWSPPHGFSCRVAQTHSFCGFRVARKSREGKAQCASPSQASTCVVLLVFHWPKQGTWSNPDPGGREIEFISAKYCGYFSPLHFPRMFSNVWLGIFSLKP